MCPDLDKFITLIFGKNTIENIIIDLSETEYLDSTCLGLLAKMANYLLNTRDKKPTIISNKENINHILKGVGFNKVFHIIKRYPQNIDELNKISIDKKDNLDTDMGKMIMDAHEALFDLNEKNKETFKDVVEIFRNQYGNTNKNNNN
jgi:anti-anti-sigma factor